jgi:hypothetical protein
MTMGTTTRQLSWIMHDTKTWCTEEQLDGTPDFIIYKESNTQYRLDHRTSACPTYHESLKAAKAHAGGM